MTTNTATATATATYAKLRSGEWGVRVSGKVSPDQTVTVTTRAGAKKTERISEVLWTGDGITLATIVPQTPIFVSMLPSVTKSRVSITVTARREAYVATRDAAIPADYMRRSGARDGGVVQIDGEMTRESGIGLAEQAFRWHELARLDEIHARAGLQNQYTFARAVLPDGRAIYRETQMLSFGDDLRTTFWLPRDIWGRIVRAEIAQAGITPESALVWLGKYRGCVGTEVYEYAAEGDHHEEDLRAPADRP